MSTTQTPDPEQQQRALLLHLATSGDRRLVMEPNTEPRNAIGSQKPRCSGHSSRHGANRRSGAHELAVADEVFEVKHQTAAKADYPQGLSPGGSVKTL